MARARHHKGHHPAQALLGHLLFVGEGVPRQRARGLMWLTLAKTAAQGPKDEWVRDLYGKDSARARATTTARSPPPC